MSTIRILIAELPTMLRDIVLDTLATEPDLEVVGVVERGGSLAGAIDRSAPAVLIVGLSDRATSGPECGGPRMPSVIALTSDGRDAVVHVAIGELSPQRLVSTIRRLPTIRRDD